MMESNASGKGGVSLETWGRLVLEELLTQGGMRITHTGNNPEPVEVALNFRLYVNREERCVEAHLLRTGGAQDVTRVFIDVGNHILGKVEDAIQITTRNIQQQAHVAGHAPGIPDVGDRGGHLNMAEALAPN